MAEWNWEIETCVGHCYTNKKFPFHVRGELADFFNRNNGFLHWNIHSPSIDTRKLIVKFIGSMRQELENIHDLLPSEGVQNSFYKKKFRKYCDKIRNTDNFQLFSIIRETLDAETKELRKPATSRAPESMDTLPAEVYEQNKSEITANLETYKINCDGIYDTIVQLDITCTEFKRQPNYQFQAMVTYLRTHKSELDRKCHDCIENLGNLQTKILEMLAEFQDKQRFVTFAFKEKNDGSNLDSQLSSLDDVHNFLGKLAECFAVLFLFSTKYKALFEQLASLEVTLENWFDQLCKLQNKTKAVCCVMEVQPSQIIRTAIKYQMKLRVLPWKNRRMQIAGVQTVLINSETAERIKAHLNTCIVGPSPLPDSCGTIATDPITWDNNSLNITGMQITEVKGSQRRSSGKHTYEERFWIYSRVRVNLEEENISEMFYTISLPILVVSHTTSEKIHVIPQVIWFNACPSNERKDCFTVPTTLPWIYLHQLIDLQLSKLGLPLNSTQADFLKMKLFRWAVRPDDMVKEDEFCGRTIDQTPAGNANPTPGPSKSQKKKPAIFSFGEWIYGCLAVLNSDPQPGSRSLKELWATGKIIGFISKPDMQEMLSSPGSCIIFFPESATETIGIQWFDLKARKVLKFSYTTDELKREALEDRILDNKGISHLYTTDADGYRLVETSQALQRKSKICHCIPNERGYFVSIPMKIQEDLSSVLEAVTLADESS